MNQRLASASFFALSLLLAPLAGAQASVYSDAFDSIGGWPDSDANGDLDAIYTIVGGEYLINPLKDRHYALAVAPARSDSGDQRIEADVRLAASNPDSRAGIACRVGRGLNFFAFNLIASRGYEIVRVVNGNPTTLTQGRISMDPAEGVRLGATCQGSALSLSVNGRELASVSDTALSDNTGAGLLSVSPVIAATNAAFDNFELGGLSGGGAVTSRAPRELPAQRTTSTSSGSSGSSDQYLGTSMPEVDDMALFNDAFGQPGSRQSLFDSGSQRVYLVMQLTSSPRARFLAKWYRVNGSDEIKLQENGMENTRGNPKVWLYAERNWAPGLYRVDIYANDQFLDQREFSIN
jgi:hypothetical protein